MKFNDIASDARALHTGEVVGSIPTAPTSPPPSRMSAFPPIAGHLADIPNVGQSAAPVRSTSTYRRTFIRQSSVALRGVLRHIL
jgi:hypothetical protein